MTRPPPRRSDAAGWLCGALLICSLALPSSATAACGLSQFQGSWFGADGRGDRFVIDAAAVMINAGPAGSRIPLQPARDILERQLEAVTAALPQVAAIHAAVLARLGPPTRRACVLQVTTPGGGSMAFLPNADGLLRLEESRSDPPVAQLLRRAGGVPLLDAPADYSRPPR